MSLDQKKGVTYLNPNKDFSFDTLLNCEIKSNMHMTTSFINHTEGDVIVVFQNGLSTTIVPDHGPNYDHYRKRDFVIRKSYIFSTNHAVRNALASLDALKRYQGELSFELSKMQENLANSNEINLRHNSVVYNIDTAISEAELASGKPVFVEDTGIMLTTNGEHAITIPHPFTREGRMIGEWSKKHLDVYEAGISVSVIDNIQICPIRYFYAGRSIVAVPSNRDNTKESGVYVTRVLQNEQGILAPVVSYYTFEEAEGAIGLYRTIDEAEANGNPEQLAKAEEARFKNDLRQAEQQFARDKHLQDVEIATLVQKQKKVDLELERFKGENERLKHELSMLKAFHDSKTSIISNDIDIKKSKRKDKDEKKSLKRKRKEDKIKQKYELLKLQRNDHYEERSAVRKDTSEIIKYAPLIITGGLAIYTIFSNMQKKSSSFD